MRKIEDPDTLDSIAFCVLFSGAALDVVADMLEKMNSDGKSDAIFFENNVDM